MTLWLDGMRLEFWGVGIFVEPLNQAFTLVHLTEMGRSSSAVSVLATILARLASDTVFSEYVRCISATTNLHNLLSVRSLPCCQCTSVRQVRQP